MYLRFYLDDAGRRVYTLKKTSPAGVETQSAHPARFSPEDKNSNQGSLLRKLLDVVTCYIVVVYFSKMLLWEWRRIFRQKLRALTPTSTLTYQQWSRRRLLMSFVLFFAGWKAFGYALNDMLLWTVDEETGVGRFLTPSEGKAQREKMERERDAQFLPARAPKKFDFDD